MILTIFIHINMIVLFLSFFMHDAVMLMLNEDLYSFLEFQYAMGSLHFSQPCANCFNIFLRKTIFQRSYSLLGAQHGV
jgi:hypothetical protein